MKGALPIPYIVALILAVAIIAVIAYLFFTQSGNLQKVFHEKYCDIKRYECKRSECLDWDESCGTKPQTG